MPDIHTPLLLCCIAFSAFIRPHCDPASSHTLLAYAGGSMSFVLIMPRALFFPRESVVVLDVPDEQWGPNQRWDTSWTWQETSLVHPRLRWLRCSLDSPCDERMRTAGYPHGRSTTKSKQAPGSTPDPDLLCGGKLSWRCILLHY